MCDLYLILKQGYYHTLINISPVQFAELSATPVQMIHNLYSTYILCTNSIYSPQCYY